MTLLWVAAGASLALFVLTSVLDFGLTLEQSVIIPLAIAAVIIAVVYRSYPVSSNGD